ncbi:MAG TPA: LLM class flavin-dependent oxidoreductase [Vicinamibacterales bacterium]|nr:LLM class flavin-dependent oxidoreductase [Vicinamibacterales bacterium]
MVRRLSVLDQAPIAAGSTGGDALRHSIDLARHTESLGYHRYWVAEHHGTPMLACAAPEVLIGPIASATTRIRVGSGGVMLPHYSPLKVAETFSMLSGLYPHRIDLGLGRAPGSDPLTAFALQRDRRQAAPDDFPEQLTELLAYLHDALPARHQFAKLSQLPGRPELPDVWLLGSSPQSGVWAAELGLPYAFADFINPAGADIVSRYKSQVSSLKSQLSSLTSQLAESVIVCGWALCAETDEEAQRLGASARMAFAKMLQGQSIPVPPVDDAVQFLAANGSAADALVRHRRWIVGTPSTVRAGIEALADEYGADEVMIVTITYDHRARRQSYALIAREFGLS